MWDLKDNPNESIYKTKRDSDIENKLMFTEGEKEGRDKLEEYGISRYKLLYIK